MPEPIALFHSAEGNVRRFAELLERLVPEAPLVHHLREDLLEAAQPQGLTPEIRREVAFDILQLAEDGAPVVLCTCSTLGPGAESAAELTSAIVLRVDRPMMEAALAKGSRIAVAAALASTLEPTRSLLERVAAEQGRELEIREIVIADAWERLAAGDERGYAARIAERLRAEASGVDAIVLAQASMAGAAELLADLAVPVFASPALGAEAAARAWRERAGKG
jgi:Asp/Glu/hydantoin racemase